MTKQEKKATRLVNNRHVDVEYHRYNDGVLMYAKGTVSGDHGVYHVTAGIDNSCDCEFGVNQPGHRHSHTIALELAAWNQARKEEMT